MMEARLALGETAFTTTVLLAAWALPEMEATARRRVARARGERRVGEAISAMGDGKRVLCCAVPVPRALVMAVAVSAPLALVWELVLRGFWFLILALALSRLSL